MLAEELMSSPTAEARQAVLRRAEDQWDKAQGQKMQKRAEIYVKVGRVNTSLYKKNSFEARDGELRKEEFLTVQIAKIKFCLLDP